MAVTPTSKSNVVYTANNTVLTYITPTFMLANANTSNGSTFRITVAGQKVSNTGINNQWLSTDQFNLHFGPNNNVTDNIVSTFNSPMPDAFIGQVGGAYAGNPYVYKQFYVGILGYSITTGFANLVLTVESVGMMGNTNNTYPTANINANAGLNFLGVSYQAVTGQSQNVYFNTGLVEQLA